MAPKSSLSCVLLADRHHGLTEGVRGLLATAFGTVVMVADEESLIDGADRLQPDVAIVDIDNEVRGVKTMPAGLPVPPDGIVKTQLMEVFVRRGGRWWVEAYHNVDTKPVN